MPKIDQGNRLKSTSRFGQVTKLRPPRLKS